MSYEHISLLVLYYLLLGYRTVQSAGENEEDKRSESTDLSQSPASNRSLLSRAGRIYI